MMVPNKIIALQICILVSILTSNAAKKVSDKTPFVLERIDHVYQNDDFVQFNVSVKRLNRNNYGVNGFVNFIQENVSEFGVIDLQLYAFQSNEYRLAPVHIKRATCSFLALEWQWFRKCIEKYTNLPLRCPVPIGLYYVKDMVMDTTNIPEFPWERMMFYAKFTMNNTIPLAEIKLYFRYDHNMKLFIQ